MSYLDLADEVVIVDGSKYPKNEPLTEYAFIKLHDKVKIVYYEWPKEFKFDFIGQQFQRGYEACTGSWVLRCDIDYVFHEKDMKDIREQLARVDLTNASAASMLKYQYIHPSRYNLKSRTVVAVNKGMYGDRIKFDLGGDLCQPSLDGTLIANPPCLSIPFYNYEHMTKTEKAIREEIGRMDRAYRRSFDKPLYKGDTFEGWADMMRGRIEKAVPFDFENHPKYIKETIKNLKPEQFGYSMFGYIE